MGKIAGRCPGCRYVLAMVNSTIVQALFHAIIALPSCAITVAAFLQQGALPLIGFSAPVAVFPFKASRMNITLDMRVVVSPEVMLQDLGGEAVLLDLKSESYFGLDAVGTRIWHLVEKDGHLEVVHATLLDEYDVDAARLEHDLKELIGRLAATGLVTVEGAGANEA
jgi:hypothetical protein